MFISISNLLSVLLNYLFLVKRRQISIPTNNHLMNLPGGHLQEYCSHSFTHVAPLLQGLLEHGLSTIHPSRAWCTSGLVRPV